MKPLLSLLTIIFLGCKNLPTKEKQSANIDTTIALKTSNPRYHTNRNTVLIVFAEYGYTDTIVYSKNDFDEIVDYFPALYQLIPEPPDSSYRKSVTEKEIITDNGNTTKISFGSDVGQDIYYILYAYFLQKQNMGKELAKRRETLISIYNNINCIFDDVNGGGTYYGHQFKRINGYAEYTVYQYKQDSSYFNKPDNIKKQKQQYLALLKQTIAKAINTNNESPDEASKEKEWDKMFSYVKQLDSLIIDSFYLRKAQEFQFSNY